MILVGVIYDGLNKKITLPEDLTKSNWHSFVEEVRQCYSIVDEIDLHLYDPRLEDFFEVNDDDFPIENAAKFKVFTKYKKKLKAQDRRKPDFNVSPVPNVIETPTANRLRNIVSIPGQFEIPLDFFSEQCKKELSAAEAIYQSQKIANPSGYIPHHTATTSLEKEIRSLIANHLFQSTSYPTDKMVKNACIVLVSHYNCLAIKNLDDPLGIETWVKTIVDKLRELRRHSTRPDVLANRGKFGRACRRGHVQTSKRRKLGKTNRLPWEPPLSSTSTSEFVNIELVSPTVEIKLEYPDKENVDLDFEDECLPDTYLEQYWPTLSPLSVTIGTEPTAAETGLDEDRTAACHSELVVSAQAAEAAVAAVVVRNTNPTSINNAGANPLASHELVCPLEENTSLLNQDQDQVYSEDTNTIAPLKEKEQLIEGVDTKSCEQTAVDRIESETNDDDENSKAASFSAADDLSQSSATHDNAVNYSVEENTTNKQIDSTDPVASALDDAEAAVEQENVMQECRQCGIVLENQEDFEQHHINHVRNNSAEVRLDVLSPDLLPPLPVSRSVAHKRTGKHRDPSEKREPIRLTLRLTHGRLAKAAEERYEAERKAKMLNALETRNDEPTSPCPTPNKEEEVYEKAICLLNDIAQEISQSPKSVDRSVSESTDGNAQYTPPPEIARPGSSDSLSSEKSAGGRSNSSTPVPTTPLISIRPADDLMGHRPSPKPQTLLQDILQKDATHVVQEPEFVSLDQLAASVGGRTPTEVALQAARSGMTSAPLHNLAAMQPGRMVLPNTLVSSAASMQSPSNSTIINSVSLSGSGLAPLTQMLSVTNTVVTPSTAPSYPTLSHQLSSMPNNTTSLNYQCDVCGQCWPDISSLTTHKIVSCHYRCKICHQMFPTGHQLTDHCQSVHGRTVSALDLPLPPTYSQAVQQRNPPPLYRPTQLPDRSYQQLQQLNQYSPYSNQQQNSPSMSNVQMAQRMPSQPIMSRLNNALQQPPSNGGGVKRPAPVGGPVSPTTPPKRRPSDVGIPAKQPDDCQIIAVQRSGDGVPQIQSIQGSVAEKPANSIVQLTNEITLSVNKPNEAARKVQQQQQQQKASKGSTVASLLADRGITVITSNKAKPSDDAQQRSSANNNQQSSIIPESLSMNSSISILPASKNQQKSPQAAPSPTNNSPTFAVPRARPPPQVTNQQMPERPPRPPTVDLTNDNVAAQGQPQMSQTPQHLRRPVVVACNICNRGMTSQAALQQHMLQIHGQQPKQQRLPYRCSLCGAQYPTVMALQHHRQLTHKEPELAPPAATANDIGIPVVDFRNPTTVERLGQLGISHYIPLPPQNGSGFFGIPIVSANSARNSTHLGLLSMNVTAIMPFGPLRAVPR